MNVKRLRTSREGYNVQSECCKNTPHTTQHQPLSINVLFGPETEGRRPVLY